MTIQSVATGMNTNMNVNLKSAPKPALAAPKKQEIPDDGDKKIVGALSALAVLSLAGIGIALSARKGKVEPNASQKAAQNVAQNLADGASKPVAAVSNAVSSAPVAPRIEKIQQTSAQPLRGGAHTKTGERVLKGAPKSTAPDTLKARRQMLEKSDAMRQTLTDGNRSVSASLGEIKTAEQGMQNATAEIADKKVQMAQNAARNAAEKADEMSVIIKEAPTHKNTKRAKVAENRAQRARIEAEKIRQNAEKRKAQLAQEAAKKEENIQRMINNTTPEKLLEGQKKMEEHAAKTSARAVQRKANRTIKHPGYQRALKKFQGYSKEKLQGVIRSTKASAAEKRVAEDLLAAAK